MGVSPEPVRHDTTPGYERIRPDDLPALQASKEESAAPCSHGPSRGRVLPHETGQDRGPMEWFEGHATPELMGDPSILWPGCIALITGRKEVERRLRELAYFDSLTGLANRALFFDLTDPAPGRAERSGDAFALLDPGLANVKDVNEAFGHPAGDPLPRGWRSASPVFRGSPIRWAAWTATTWRSSWRPWEA